VVVVLGAVVGVVVGAVVVEVTVLGAGAFFAASSTGSPAVGELVSEPAEGTQADARSAISNAPPT
jgi:hypothetical protein